MFWRTHFFSDIDFHDQCQDVGMTQHSFWCLRREVRASLPVLLTRKSPHGVYHLPQRYTEVILDVTH